MATGLGTPGNLRMPAFPPAYPPPTSTLPVPVAVGAGGSTWVFPGGLQGRERAHHFVGALQAHNPGLAVRIYNTGVIHVIEL